MKSLSSVFSRTVLQAQTYSFHLTCNHSLRILNSANNAHKPTVVCSESGSRVSKEDAYKEMLYNMIVHSLDANLKHGMSFY